MHSIEFIARGLALAFVAGPMDPAGMTDRAHQLFGHRWRWVPFLTRRTLAKFGAVSRPRISEVKRFLLADKRFRMACQAYAVRLPGIACLRSMMVPAASAVRWSVPEIATAGRLAEWLELGVRQIDWFADLKSLERMTQPGSLRHYHYRWVPRRGGVPRLIEIPKSRLKSIQRRILADVLDHIPPHESVHGFRVGRSARSFAEPHTGQTMVLRMDLDNFFATVARTRVVSLFMTAGYPERVAALLAGLCTNAVPRDVFDELCGSIGNHTHEDTSAKNSDVHEQYDYR